MSDYIILCDFDGTITLEDTVVPILEQYTVGDWKKYDVMLSQGLINLHECMQKQFEMIQASIPQIISSMESFHIRPGFAQFVSFCLSQEIDVIIVSAGLEFIIRNVLSENDLDIPIVAAKVKDERFQLEFPLLHYPDSIDFKVDQVKYYQAKQKKVIFIGDGNSDLQGAMQANLVFAVKNSFLNSHFENSFTSFEDLKESLMKL